MSRSSAATARLASAAEAPPAALHAFLERAFGSTKADFLRDHGAWWHRGDKHRLVLLVGGEVAAYTGVIPTAFRFGDEEYEGAWWMDLVVAPEHRRQGLERRLDAEVRRRFRWVLGFPNAMAAKIHRRHSWGVREDLRVHLLPLDPRRMPTLRRGSSPLRRGLKRLAAGLAAPVTRIHRHRLLRQHSRLGQQNAPALQNNLGTWADPSAEALATVAARTPRFTADGRPWLTAARASSDLAWRYLEGPPTYRRQLRFHTLGPADAPRLLAVVRHTGRGARVLDLVGDLDRPADAATLLRWAAAHAAADGEPQITALAANSLISSSLRRAGFLLHTTARFCWLGPTPGQTRRFAAPGEFHWTLGDSDNDEPR